MEERPARPVCDNMKYAYQIMVIGGFALAGEFLNHLLPLPVPASVYGMVLLLICLCTKWIRVSQIEETAEFLLAAMPLVFVGPGVALMEYFGILRDSLPGIFAVSLVSTVAVIATCGRVVQFLIRRKEKEAEAGKHE